jgi:hypothetical protein
MTTIALAPSASPAAIPTEELLPWAIFVGLLLLIAIYFVGAEERRNFANQGHVRA